MKHLFWFPVWFTSVDPWNILSRRIVSCFTGSSTAWVVALMIYPMPSTSFGILVFFANSNILNFLVVYWAFFHLFSVIKSFTWFWVGSLPKSIQQMLELIKPSLLILHFSYINNIMMMMWSVILRRMLMIPHSNASVTKHLICYNNWSWL